MANLQEQFHSAVLKPEEIQAQLAQTKEIAVEAINKSTALLVATLDGENLQVIGCGNADESKALLAAILEAVFKSVIVREGAPAGVPLH